jgi:DNA primase
MQISQDFIQKIKDNITISEFLQKYIQIIPAGHARHKALCPFHNEKTPSFLINDDKSSYHCFGCGAHGDAITFLIEKEGCSFVDAVKYLANMAGLQIPEKLFDVKAKEKANQDYQIFNEVTSFFEKKLSENNLIQQYLVERAINQSLIAEFNIGYAPPTKVMDEFVRSRGYSIEKLIELGVYRRVEDRDPYFLFYNRVIFPIKNHQGHIIAFGGRVVTDAQPKYINSPEHEYFKKREVLFNWYKAKEEIKSCHQVVVCEGYMDVLALHKNGFTNAVAPLGTAFSEYHLKILWQYCDKPVICLDGDVAGRRAML